MSRPAPSGRAEFAVFRPMALRWNDNDPYGHMNNAVHYQLFDTAVNDWLLEEGLLERDLTGPIYLVVATSCSYFAELGYPDPVEIGLSVRKLGTSSVTYHLGLFRKGADTCAAEGDFTHVLVDEDSRKSKEIPAASRAAFAALLRD